MIGIERRSTEMRRDLKRKDVARLVLKVIQGWHFDTQVTETTDFDIDIPIDKGVKRLYYYAIKLSFEKDGYSLCDFSPTDCEKAESVKDIIDAVWEDFDSNSKRVA